MSASKRAWRSCASGAAPAVMTFTDDQRSAGWVGSVSRRRSIVAIVGTIGKNVGRSSSTSATASSATKRGTTSSSAARLADRSTREHEAADVHHRHGAEQALLAGDELRAALGELALAGDEVGVREHRALRGAGRPARVLEHRDVAGSTCGRAAGPARREHLGEVGDDRLGLQRDAVVQPS